MELINSVFPLFLKVLLIKLIVSSSSSKESLCINNCKDKFKRECINGAELYRIRQYSVEWKTGSHKNAISLFIDTDVINDDRRSCAIMLLAVILGDAPIILKEEAINVMDE